MFQVYAANVQQLIDAGRDLYLRGTESRSGVGVAYISHERHPISGGSSNDVGCRGPPSFHHHHHHSVAGAAASVGLLNVTRWHQHARH